MRLRKNMLLRMRHILCVLLVAVLVASSVSAGGMAVLAAPLTLDIGVNPDSVTATLKENGVLSITGAGEIRDFTEETAPFERWDVKSVEFGAGVTAIGDYTFYNCSGLDGLLTLSKGIVRIGSHAFSGKTEKLAPNPDFVENLFVDALVTSVEKPTEDVSSAAAEEPAGEPAESAAQEGGAGDAMLSEEKTTDASGPEEDEPTDSPDTESAPEQPAESAAPVEPEEETPAAPEHAPEQKETYTVTKITEQEVGKEIFFPHKEAGVFLCSEENETFRTAMKTAGYEKADAKVAVTMNSGEGSAENGDTVKNLPVLSGKLILPALPPEFSAPKEEELFSYEFDGWTEKDDAAGVVRKPGSRFPVGEKSEFYFIANWAKVVKIAIETHRVKDTVTYSVPEISGYDVLAYQWQTKKAQGEWTAIEDATEQQYSRKLQAGDGDRLFRCTITVKKRQNILIQLFSAAKEEELSLPAAQSGLTELSETVAVKKGSGVQTVTKTISLPVSEDGTSYRITGAELPAGAKFVEADAALPADGRTFSLEIAPTGTNWQETETEAQLLSAESKGTSGTAHLRQTGDDPIANEAGAAEMEITLQYNAAYETFSGGTIGLTLEEYSGDEAKNLVTAAIALADIGDVTQEAFAASGRSFVFPSGNGAVVTQKGGLTAGFVTEYSPAQTGAGGIKLSLYRADGTAVAFPNGTKLVLADVSGDIWSYSSYKISSSSPQSITLDHFSGDYSGPSQVNVPVTERLLFVLDFYKTSATFAEGDYYLELTHSALQDGAVETPQKASFTVQAASGTSISAEKTEDSNDTTLWGVRFASSDGSSGIWAQATLQNSEGTVFSFPAGMKLTGAQAIARNKDKSWQFAPQGDTVYFDFSEVAAGAFNTGEYQIKLQMGPRPGLQNGGETSLSETETILTFRYEDKEPVAKPAVRSLSVEADERLLDVSEEAATLTLSINYENAQDGDTLRVEVLTKGDNTDPNDYRKQTGTMPIVVGNVDALTTDDGKHTQTVTLTVPKGKPEGTFRALVTIVDANGNTVAKEPYNFIIK